RPTFHLQRTFHGRLRRVSCKPHRLGLHSRDYPACIRSRKLTNKHLALRTYSPSAKKSRPTFGVKFQMMTILPHLRARILLLLSCSILLTLPTAYAQPPSHFRSA